jgi:hypothetical protein
MTPTIAALFEKDINRRINGVIKVGQLEEEVLKSELEEYVLTPEVRREFNRLFAHYVTAGVHSTDQIGVWISGFFGSGKSHFLKMLSYLLSNRVVAGKPALEWFRAQVKDANLEAMLERASSPSAEVILFNIDAEAAADGKQNKSAIVRVFQKVFDNHRGYFGTDAGIARFERLMDEAGQLEAFKTAFFNSAGAAWEASRDAWDFFGDAIAQALTTTRGMSADAERNFFEAHRSHPAPSPKEFALEVKKYLERRPGIRVVFMVDEVGQYIGANTDLMLNLQTVVEELGTQCQGRAWVVVTSQEDLDSLIGLDDGGSSRKRDDFSKIQGRFLKPISLSSRNADEVIQLRLLSKTSSARSDLEALFERSEATLGTLLRFEAHKHLPAYRDAEEFVRAYPFVPYQFPLLQDVFTQARRMGASGRHLASGERSMLDAFRIAALKVKDAHLGALAPFHLFYDAIEGFLEGAVKRVIERAKENPKLKPGDVDLLKTLFMVKYVQGFDGNLENLTTLALTQVDEDRVALKARLEASLGRLESQTLVSRTNDRFTFLTDDEQDVTRQINTVTVDPSSIAAKLQEIVWEEIFTDKKYRADRWHDFGFNRVLDGRAHGRQAEQLTLHVVTPESDWHERDQGALLGSGNALEALIVLPNDKRLIQEAKLLLRTEGFLRLANTTNASPQLKLVIEAKRSENADRQSLLRALLEEALGKARVLVSMREINCGDDSKAPFKAGLEALVRDNYHKFEMVKGIYETEAQVDNALQKTLLETPNLEARTEVKAWLERQMQVSERVTVKALVEAFNRVPYGWSELDALGVMMELVAGGAVELRFAQGEAPLQPGLTAKIRGKGGLDSHTLRVPRAVDPAALGAARDLARELYGLAVPTSDPRELFELHRKRLADRAADAARLLARAREGHPFATTLEGIAERVAEFAKPMDLKTLLETLHAERTALEADWARLEEIEGFYTRQFSAYQDARETVKTLRADAPHVPGNVVNDAIQAVTKILESESLTKELPRVRTILGPAVRAVRAERDRLRERVASSIAAAAQDLAELSLQAQRPDALQPLEALKTEVGTLERLDALIARESVAQSKAAEIRAALLSAVTPADTDQPALVIKAVRAPRRTIRHAADLEAYLAELRARITAELERGANAVTVE